MATVADIERLKALSDRLLPLSSRVRGEVIAADDWNTVVGALLEVARAVVSHSAETAVPQHEHPDQVGLGWLDPRLRALIERGPLADPASTSRITAVERQAALLGRRLEALSAQVRDLRVAGHRQETNDLDRASTLTELSRKVSGLADPRNEIAALRESLDGISANVSAVGAFAAGLGDLTPAAVRAGLEKVDQLRERLTTATGALLDAAEFERRLTELRTTLVTEEELSEALKKRPAQLTGAARAELLAEARSAAQRQAEDSATTITAALREQLASRFDEVTRSAAQAARAAAADFGDELKHTITEQLAKVIAEGQRASEDRLNANAGAVGAALRAAVDERITRLEGSLDNRVAAAIGAAQPNLLAQLNAAVDARVSGLDNRLAALQNQAAALNAQVLTEQKRVNQALADLQRQIPGKGVTREELAAELARNNERLGSEIRATTDAIVTKRLDERLGGRPQPRPNG